VPFKLLTRTRRRTATADHDGYDTSCDLAVRPRPLRERLDDVDAERCSLVPP
jgi:hypothetical protein